MDVLQAGTNSWRGVTTGVDEPLERWKGIGDTRSKHSSPRSSTHIKSKEGRLSRKSCSDGFDNLHRYRPLTSACTDTAGGRTFFSRVDSNRGLLTACCRSTCLRVWLASLDFIQLFFFPRSICTSSASLLVEWRTKNSRGKENSGETMFFWKRFLAHVNKPQPGTHYIFGNKTVRLHNTGVWT